MPFAGLVRTKTKWTCSFICVRFTIGFTSAIRSACSGHPFALPDCHPLSWFLAGIPNISIQNYRVTVLYKSEIRRLQRGFTLAFISAIQRVTIWRVMMKNIRLIASSMIMGAALLPAVAMAAGHNAVDSRRAEVANLPACSSNTTGDCHVHSREAYLELRPNRPNEKKQPHAWWEYDRQRWESRQLSRE